jgi:hypothetical protein
MRNVLAAVVAGIAGGLAWVVGLFLFFIPAQRVLANPAYQSPKFLAVMSTIQPLPRVAETPWVIPAGLVVIGVIHALVYAWIRGALGSGGALSRGSRFGLVAWALMAPWFEFYLPWNVMREPALLVLLELALWLAVLVVVGVAIALVYERMTAEKAPATAAKRTLRSASSAPVSAGASPDTRRS